MKTILPNEIIFHILDLSNINCHCCNKKFDFSFSIFQSNFYFCSKDCYNFI